MAGSKWGHRRPFFHLDTSDVGFVSIAHVELSFLVAGEKATFWGM
jgi:hypothetical protein